MKKIIICLFMLLCLCSCKNEDVIKDKNLVSDENRMVYTDGIKNTYVFYYKDNDVIGYDLYIECESKVDASYKIQDVEEMLKSESGVEDVSLKDQYIVVKYGESVYKDLKVDNLDEKYSHLKKVN